MNVPQPAYRHGPHEDFGLKGYMERLAAVCPDIDDVSDMGPANWAFQDSQPSWGKPVLIADFTPIGQIWQYFGAAALALGLTARKLRNYHDNRNQELFYSAPLEERCDWTKKLPPTLLEEIIIYVVEHMEREAAQYAAQHTIGGQDGTT